MGCKAPQGSWIDPQPPTNVLRPAVMAVLVDLSGCPEGSDCPLPGFTQQSWQERVSATLRDPVEMSRILHRTVERGLCAGQHEDGVTDEITVSTECTQRWEGYKVFACTPRRPTDPPDFDTCPVLGRGKVRWAIPTLGYVPAGSCLPSTPPPTPGPTPTPTPVPTPVPGACPIAAPGENWLGDLKPHGGQQLDLTPWVGNPTHQPNNPWPGCGVNRCPLSAEKGPIAAACQRALFGDPVWGTSGGECSVFPPNPDSLMTVKVASGSCALFVHGSAGSPMLGPWEVHAGVPACNVGGDGLCH